MNLNYIFLYEKGQLDGTTKVLNNRFKNIERLTYTQHLYKD